MSGTAIEGRLPGGIADAARQRDGRHLDSVYSPPPPEQTPSVSSQTSESRLSVGQSNCLTSQLYWHSESPVTAGLDPGQAVSRRLKRSGCIAEAEYALQ